MLLIRSIFFTFLCPGTVTILIPYLTLRGNSSTSAFAVIRYLGLPLIAIGALGLLWCVWQFFTEGHGTLAPIDPPKQLVMHGLYRYVRNPMYVSALTVILGEALFFASLPILLEAGIFFIAINLFVLAYEEPVLHEKFGESYADYKGSVGRWLPRW